MAKVIGLRPFGIEVPVWEILDPPLTTLMKNLQSETESYRNLEILPRETNKKLILSDIKQKYT